MLNRYTIELEASRGLFAASSAFRFPFSIAVRFLAQVFTRKGVASYKSATIVSSSTTRGGVKFLLISGRGSSTRRKVGKIIVSFLGSSRSIGSFGIEPFAVSQCPRLVWRPIFFFFFEIIQTDLQSGTTTCRSANIMYKLHNMYLIFRVTSNTAEYKYQCVAKHISKTEIHLIHNCYQQEPFTCLNWLKLIKHITLNTY
jgi:hypothetical protein